ncbi:PepSY domain-containing protein [Actinorhabdospora filicis]|uniref:PepSY domain-containing protein n=1 Tax=Actinorhabdospora filicis TaxID=1785913 RepID=UPI002555E78B|nr:hypothetical protein [Actinorhabdospora filicis]
MTMFIDARRFGLATALAVAAVLAAGTASAAQDPREAPPQVDAARVAAIAEERLPECRVTGLELYHDDERPMWFVETECSNGTWKDLRIDGISGKVIAINGDYTV